MKEFFPQAVATLIIILFIPLLKFAMSKLTIKFGRITLKSESRTLHIVRIINILINVFGIIIIAIIWGVRPQNMMIAASSVFAVIGVAFFAQWSILSNITAGLIIFFTTPFRIGHEITIVDKDMPIVATIESILTFYTHLRTDDGELIVIPNSLFLQKIVSMGKHKENED